jgi:leader peptidase (prepilin peptidase)/N-methyltransferase
MIETLFESTPLLLAGVFVFGLIIGSFLNVVILRVPPLLEHDWRCQCQELLQLKSDEDEPPPGIVFARSKCPKCGHHIRAIENIPVLSFLVLKGKCAACKARISIRYPLVELTTAILFAVTIWHFGPNLQGLTALFLTAFLVTLAGIDADHQLLPDNMTLPLLWAGILLSYLALWSVYHLFRMLTGKEGMGYGDFKLLGALGAWMGWQMLPLIILLSSVVGALFGLILMSTGKMKRDNPMPFGPFIAAAGWIALIWGEQIISHYTRSGVFG